MSTETKIEWTDSTWNPWIGCGKVSPGCDNCYAEVSTPARTMKVIWGVTAERVRTSVHNWNLPKRWNSQHKVFFEKHGRRQRVFCASLADVFDKAAPAEWRLDIWNVIDATPELDYLLLTKRIGNVEKMVPLRWLQPGGWPKNVRIGISVVNQEEADRDIPKLLALGCPNFLSMEPLLGPVNLADISDGHADSTIPREYWEDGFDTDASPPAVGHNALSGERWQRFGEWRKDGPHIDWVIVGGESGHNARPMHPDWVRSLRDQCVATATPFLFKQYGEWTHTVPLGAGEPDLYMHADGRHATEEEALADGGSWQGMHRLGKKAAGRELDGRTWDGYPS